MPSDPDNTKKTQGKGKRPLGLYKGEIWMAEDFDAPMELIESAKLRKLEAEAALGRKKAAKPSNTAKKNRSR